MFVLVETLIFGVGLLMTLWGGMKSNEIKSEGDKTSLYAKQCAQCLGCHPNLAVERSVSLRYPNEVLRAAVERAEFPYR